MLPVKFAQISQRKLPVTVLSGFLGADKTTLLKMMSAQHDSLEANHQQLESTHHSMEGQHEKMKADHDLLPENFPAHAAIEAKHENCSLSMFKSSSSTKS